MGLSVDAAPRPASDFKVRDACLERTNFTTRGPVQVIMAGDLAVGKSCIVKRFTSERFDPALPPTIGALRIRVSLQCGLDTFEVQAGRSHRKRLLLKDKKMKLQSR